MTCACKGEFFPGIKVGRKGWDGTGPVVEVEHHNRVCYVTYLCSCEGCLESGSPRKVVMYHKSLIICGSQLELFS